MMLAKSIQFYNTVFSAERRLQAIGRTQLEAMVSMRPNTCTDHAPTS
jgi:hypothetical protein